MCFESASPLLYLRAAALMALLALVGAPPSRSATVTATASGQPRPSSANAASAPGCSAALEAACAAQRSDVFKCAECAGRNERALHLAGCDNDAISAWCAGLPPPAPTAFPGSRLITAEWGTQLNEWAGKLAGQEWELCYTSFTMDKSTPTGSTTSGARFAQTLSVANNPGAGLATVPTWVSRPAKQTATAGESAATRTSATTPLAALCAPSALCPRCLPLFIPCAGDC